MKTVVANSVVAQLAQRWRMGEATKGIGCAEAGVINQDDKNVRRIVRQVLRFDAAFVDGFL